MPIPVPVELDQPQAGSGLLAQSRPLPDGWQRGISFTDTSCLSPTVVGECPTTEDLKTAERADAATFRPVQVVQSIQCSTLDNRTDWAGISASELDRTRDDALARELLTGEASARDASGDTGNPALVNATDLGDDATSLTVALGCLETAVLTENAGRGAVMFMPVSVAYSAMDIGLIWRDGATWRTVMGSKVIVSAGFDGRAPVADPDNQVPPEPGDKLYVYATTSVWAGTGERLSLNDVDRTVNDVTARSEDIAMAAFSPCALFAVGTPVVACPAIV